MKFLLLGFLLLAQASPPLQSDRRAEQLQKERDKLAGTSDPVGRTKTEINIAKIHISAATDAAKAGDLPAMDKSLTQFLDTIRDANETMMKSGRDAHRKSGGFKDLEIYLRGSLRQLDDIGDMLRFDERDGVEKAKAETTRIKDMMIKALFFGGKN